MDIIPLGTKIKTLRKKKKLTQSDVAKHLNINVPTYSKYENNIYQPKEETLRKIAQVLDVDIATFYDEGRFNTARHTDLDKIIDWNTPLVNNVSQKVVTTNLNAIIDWNIPLSDNNTLNNIDNPNLSNLINVLNNFNYSCEPRTTTLTNTLNLIISSAAGSITLKDDEINILYKNIEHYIKLLITEKLYQQTTNNQ